MLIDDIIAGLETTGGNAVAVAEKLSVSPSYVYRIKRERWQPAQTEAPEIEEPSDTALEVPPKNGKAIVPTRDDVIQSLAPNLSAIQTLRDDTIAKLRGMIEAGSVSANVMAKLLSTLLKYEATINEIARPTLNLYDQRQQTQYNLFSGLVDQLTELDPDRLRALAGIDAPLKLGEIIEYDSD